MYEAACSRIGSVLSELGKHIDTGLFGRPVILCNTLSWERAEWIKTDGRWVYAAVPSIGYSVADASVDMQYPGLTASPDALENDLLKVSFNADGSITSIFDKSCSREIVESGRKANLLTVYRDEGDAWDFRMDYADQPKRYLELLSVEPYTDGPRASIIQTFRIGYSQVVQEIALYAGSKRIDFRAKAVWREADSMLRTSFPLDIHAEQANFEIQFGHIRRNTHRNTSWDLAKDEVPAHKWVDLSQGDYGVALLNDCKCGHKVKGNTIDLNLVRSVVFPDPNPFDTADVRPGQPNERYTDQCDYIFNYALYLHCGEHIAGGVIHAGYEFNIPLYVIPTDRCRRAFLPSRKSFISLDNGNVIIEAVKRAEDSEAVVVRLYEASHSGVKTGITFGVDIESIFEAGLLEEEIMPVDLAGNRAVLNFRPFEIKTLVVHLKKNPV